MPVAWTAKVTYALAILQPVSLWKCVSISQATIGQYVGTGHIGCDQHTNNAPECPDELSNHVSMGIETHFKVESTYVVDLSWRGAADGIGDTDTVDADLVDRPVQRQEVDQVRPEGVFAGNCVRLVLSLINYDSMIEMGVERK
jgi:hypothetical protein